MVLIHLDRNDKDDPNTNEEAMAALRINVKSKDKELVGRLFSAKIIEQHYQIIPAFLLVVALNLVARYSFIGQH